MNTPAAKAFKEHRKAVDKLLREIRQGIEKNTPNPALIDYGHVGTMAHYRGQLEEIADSMMGRGEFAES